MYNTSLNSPSNTPIILPNRPCQVVVASPIPTSSCHQYGEAYSVNGFHTQPSSFNSCMLKTVMARACNTFQRAHGEVCCRRQPALRLPPYGKDFCWYPGINLSSGLENQCINTINAGSCNGNLGILWPHDVRSSQIYGTTPCFPPYGVGPSRVEIVPCIWTLKHFQEDVLVENRGFNYFLNNIPPFNKFAPMDPS